MSGAAVTRRRRPACGAPVPEKHAPFCARRCGGVDLGRWLGGGHYAIPDEPDADAVLREDRPSSGNGADAG